MPLSFMIYIFSHDVYSSAKITIDKETLAVKSEISFKKFVTEVIILQFILSKIESNRLNMFDSENIMRVIYGLLLLVLILGWNLSDIRSRLSKSIQYVYVWIFIFGAIIIFVTMTDMSSSSTIVNSA